MIKSFIDKIVNENKELKKENKDLRVILGDLIKKEEFEDVKSCKYKARNIRIV